MKYYYLVLLFNDKYYVVSSSLTEFDIDDIYKDSLLCDWLLINNPVKIIEKVNSNMIDSLDDYVIMCMEKYGIYNVRGGSYINATLSFKDRIYLYNIIKQSSYDVKKEKKHCLSWLFDLFSYKSECKKPLLSLDD